MLEDNQNFRIFRKCTDSIRPKRKRKNTTGTTET